MCFLRVLFVVPLLFAVLTDAEHRLRFRSGSAGATPVPVPTGPNFPSTARAIGSLELNSAMNLNQWFWRAGVGFRLAYEGQHKQLITLFLPATGIDATKPVDVFFFAHGLRANYRQGYNALSQSHFAQAITEAAAPTNTFGAKNVIGIAPNPDNTNWELFNGSGFESIIADALTRVGTALGVSTPLTRGGVSVAGHSAGGRALGGAAQSIDSVTDVTLQDAGYGWGQPNPKTPKAPPTQWYDSFMKLRDWALSATPGTPRLVRIISHEPPLVPNAAGVVKQPADSNTRCILAQPGGFHQQALETRITELNKNGYVVTRSNAAPSPFNKRKQDSPAELEYTLTVSDAAGQEVAVFQVWGIKTSHDGVRNMTMKRLIMGGSTRSANLFA